MLRFSSTIYGLSAMGVKAWPWQISESYLHPISSDTSYKVNNINHLIRIDRTYGESNHWTAFKVATYILSAGILPLVALGVKGFYRWWFSNRIIINQANGVSNHVRRSSNGNGNININNSNKVFIYPTPAQSGGLELHSKFTAQKPYCTMNDKEPKKTFIPATTAPLLYSNTPSITKNSFSAASSISPLSQSSPIPTSMSLSAQIPTPMTQSAPASTQNAPQVISDHKIIMSIVDLNALSDDLKDVLNCQIEDDFYNSASKDMKPVFILEEGITISHTAALQWANTQAKKMREHAENSAKQAKNKQELPPRFRMKGLILSEIPSFTQVENKGLFQQMRYQDGKIFWVEPIHGKRLGEEGFKKPYFCPLDGFTYDLDSFTQYIANEREMQSTTKPQPIKSPANPKLTFTDIKLYPNTQFYQLIAKDSEIKQPEYIPATFKLNQMAVIDGQLHWMEPVRKVPLGDPGFKKPYFCPLDGFTYDLDAFTEYVNSEIDEQIAVNGSVTAIPCPGKPTNTFVLVELTPNKYLYKLLGTECPTQSETIQIPSEQLA